MIYSVNDDLDLYIIMTLLIVLYHIFDYNFQLSFTGNII